MNIIVGGELMCIFEGRKDIKEALADGAIGSYKKALESCSGIVILTDTEQVFEDYVREAGNAGLPAGLYIAQQLRLAGITAPILFTSYASRKEVYDDKPERGILNVVGHDYIQQPAGADAFMDMLKGKKALGKLELYDIQNAYCCREGIIDNIVHDLEDALRRCDSDKEKKQLFMSALAEMAGIYAHHGAGMTATFELAYPAINNRNVEAALRAVKAYRDELICENPSDKAAPDLPAKKRTWKILWLDDQVTDDHPLITLLGNRGVKVIPAQLSVDGRKILHNDWKNELSILIVIADYRLYEYRDGVRVQQPLQGYSLLKRISSKRRMIRLVALSGLPRKLLLRSFRHFNIRTEVYSKHDYLSDEHTMRLLCDELIETGDEQQEAIYSLPDDAKGWKFLKLAYTGYRNHPDYVEMERRISAKARRFVEHFKLYGKFPGFIGFNLAPFKENSNPEKNLEKFKLYFLGRRLAIWLSRQGDEYDSLKIRELLTGKTDDSKLAARNMISQVLALRLEDFPFGLTVEEQRWFDDDLQENISSDVRICRLVLLKMEQFFKKEVRKHPSFFAQIKRNGDAHKIIKKSTRKGKTTTQKGQEIIKAEKEIIRAETITFNEEGRPALKSFLYARLLYNEFVDMLDPFDPSLSKPEKTVNKQHAQAFSRRLKEALGQWMLSQEVKDLMPEGKVPDLIRKIADKLARDAGAEKSWLTPGERMAIVKYFNALPDYKGLEIPDDDMELATQVLLACAEAGKMLDNQKQTVTLEMVTDWVNRWKKSNDDEWRS